MILFKRKEAAIKHSYGVLLYRRPRHDLIEVLLVHPGGPFYQNKEEGVWSIPKGEPTDPSEEGWRAAWREFEEELGFRPNTDGAVDLGTVQQTNKIVRAWAVEGDLPEGWRLNSQCFELEWPPNSGRRRLFPEVDRAAFFELTTAKKKIIPAQGDFLDRLRHILKNKDHALS